MLPRVEMTAVCWLRISLVHTNGFFHEKVESTIDLVNDPQILVSMKFP